MDKRYNSGTSLTRTDKEERLDAYERALRVEFTDEEYLALKKLPLTVLKRLHKALQERLVDPEGV